MLWGKQSSWELMDVLECTRMGQDSISLLRSWLESQIYLVSMLKFAGEVMKSTPFLWDVNYRDKDEWWPCHMEIKMIFSSASSKDLAAFIRLFPCSAPTPPLLFLEDLRREFKKHVVRFSEEGMAELSEVEETAGAEKMSIFSAEGQKCLCCPQDWHPRFNQDAVDIVYCLDFRYTLIYISSHRCP